jgi:hypothetical protein
MTRTSLCLAIALTACSSPAPPTGTLHIDSQPYATLQEAGWVHTSGEVALPMNGQIATVNGLDFPLNELDMCIGERCTNIKSNSIVIDGETVLIDGEQRGELLNANAAGRKSAVLALASYQPPGGVWATESSFETTSIGALPDGRLVQGEPCGWPSQCSSLNAVGSWTPEQITLRGITHRIDTLVEETPEATIVSGAPEHSVRLYFPKSRPPSQSMGRLTWVTPRQIELDFYRPADAAFDSAIGRAITVALAMELDRVSGLVEPPPPPPPRQ